MDLPQGVLAVTGLLLPAAWESVATVPMIIFPRFNAAHARQPAWNDRLDRLRSVGVDLIYDEQVWPLAESGTAGPRRVALGGDPERHQTLGLI
jgi:hypothetical protein